MSNLVVVDFVHLPLDIHLSILRYLEPSDILVLRRTCKTLWHATTQHVIWLEAVEEMCVDNTVYRYSFPTEEMSAVDLEYASMAPVRWDSFVGKSDPSQQKTTPESVGRAFVLPVSSSTEEDDLRYTFLIPGGRFLVFLEAKLLMLWDLGYPRVSGCTEGEIKLVAQTTMDCLSITTHLSPDGRSIRLFVLLLTPDHRALQCDMLQIDPHDPKPTFTTIASHTTQCHYNLAFTSVCGDMVALVFGPFIRIWDIKTNKCASWNTSREPLQILMNADFVVLVHLRDCTVWRVPELSECASSGSQRFILSPNDAEPLKTLPYIHGFETSVVECFGLCDWYTGSPQPLWFDIQPRGYKSTTCRFIADLSDPSPDNFSIRPMTSLNIPEHYREPMDPYRVCGNHVVAPWCSYRSFLCDSQKIQPTMDQAEWFEKVFNLFDNDDSEDWEGRLTCSLCPVAGRLVVARSGSNKIQVIDLFSPIPSPESNFFNIY